RGYKAIGSLLLDNGAEMDETTISHKSTPLHFATIKGHEAIAQLLIDKGADINAQDESGRTPLHYAAQIPS
ncbi:ankyrin repeat domain-containing protein, partial [bacterium]|nr:ankyrin repeat domain-containing protein [bacterium]